MQRILAALALLVLCSFAASGCNSQADTESPYDVLIVNGSVYDGSLREPRSTNIGIVGDRIVSMQAASDADATVTIDAAGLAVMPGFIDPHTHAGGDLLDDESSSNINYLTQGVATVFIGNDGGGFSRRSKSAARMRERGIGTNVAFYAGHGSIRREVMGLEDRAPTEDEIERMRELVAEEMRAGALGLSTGLFYAPGSYASTDEVVELAKVAARFGGVYDSHIRDEASYTIGLLGSIEEVLEIGGRARIPVHIAHLKALGRDVWGKSGDIVALIEAGRERGLAITADQYPWQASGTRFSNALIPRWVMADSRKAMFKRLDNADLRDRIREQMAENLWRRGGSESMLVTAAGQWQGMTLADIALQMDVDPLEAAIEIVRNGDPSIASFNMQPDDIAVIASQPWVMTGSDGTSGHPRKFASYPKTYRDMVHERALFPMQRFVHRSSGLVADTFSLCDRGYLEHGRKADVVILDLDDYKPVADFRNPTALSTGVVHMLVNGIAVIRKGEYSGKLPGRILTRQECR
jgi:N-acyl-D-aspartate/D-glutamate deacylase